MQATKICKMCGEEKDLEMDFYFLKKSKDGHTNICRPCSTIVRRKYGTNRNKANLKKWKKENRERINEYARRYHQKRKLIKEPEYNELPISIITADDISKLDF